MALLNSEKTVEDIFGDLLPGDECNIACYSKHAKYYDKCLNEIKYTHPRSCAGLAMKHVDNKGLEMQALDICVGTGMASKELLEAGFIGKIDGVDGNEDMMKQATKKGIFRDLLKHVVKPNSNLPFEDGTYDIVICTGSFSAGHVNPECLQDFFRVLKTGGILSFNTTSFTHDEEKSNENDIQTAEDVLKKLVKEGVCEMVEEVLMSAYEVSEQFKYLKGGMDKVHCYRKK